MSKVTQQEVVQAYNTQVGFLYLFIKRSFDFISSLLFSVVLIIPMAVITLIIFIKDTGNPFYVQKRIGKGGKTIGVLKFRSMIIGADDLQKTLSPKQLEEYKREFKLKDDPRLIGYKKAGDGEKCFGAIIRRTSIDELPQILWNICIKGNMSVVGPRPLLPEELEKSYSPDEQKLFLSMKPGLTGYWQAYARNNATYQSGERQRMELYYARNRSILFDIRIILKSIITVIKKSGAK